MTAPTIDRRQFIKLGAIGLATTAVGLGVAGNKLGAIMPPAAAPAAAPAASSGPAETSPHEWAMVIDQSKCTGCELCVKACQAYNDVQPDRAWARVEQEAAAGQVGERPVFRPVPCQHCADAPCVEVCPVGATYQRPDGIVMMNYDRCIGCRYCQLACPYGARSFNWEAFTGDNPVVPAYGQPEVPRRPRGVAEKCSFCYQRIDRGLAFGMKPGVDAAATPACVVACPEGARLFGDLNDPESPVSVAIAAAGDRVYRLREHLGTEPRVYYLAAEPAPEEELS
jgi:Fe-S-cluster-containing dehydrogenase component